MSLSVPERKPTWLITGCSSGLGSELASAVLAAGWNAVVTARDRSALQGLAAAFPHSALPLALDVTDSSQIVEVVRAAIARFGQVDVLVNNAGHGFRSAVEEATQPELDELFATNFFGPVALIREVLPGMRARRSGAIINVSSMAARHAAAGSGFYSASKCALEGMSDGLRKEVGPLGIKVMVVAPGQFRTNFSGRSLRQSRSAIPDYADTAGRRRKERETSHGNQPGNPLLGAKAIIDTIGADDAPFMLFLGRDAVKVVSASIDALKADITRWAAVSESTDF
ncbi:oxidoreductase [Variovorax sp. J22R133]|uniref:oxidoreductase n=1 Tax=Variovorax brevis TaxID=3053503 RepID=UPI002577B81C|nr:oxidoreductase [Variovorax sp. J22R133]MDM0116273.1 oxidoreductase [Variovorax sp. J22R133]